MVTLSSLRCCLCLCHLSFWKQPDKDAGQISLSNTDFCRLHVNDWFHHQGSFVCDVPSHYVVRTYPRIALKEDPSSKYLYLGALNSHTCLQCVQSVDAKSVLAKIFQSHWWVMTASSQGNRIGTGDDKNQFNENSTNKVCKQLIMVLFFQMSGMMMKLMVMMIETVCWVFRAQMWQKLDMIIIIFNKYIWWSFIIYKMIVIYMKIMMTMMVVEGWGWVVREQMQRPTRILDPGNSREN